MSAAFGVATLAEGVNMSEPVPLISVIIPFYNAGRFIETALLDLADQTLRDFEIIIVDDGSTPLEARRAKEIAARWGARYLRQENAGPGAARNRGAEAAQGTWLAFFDADDRWAPTKLAKQYEAGAQGGDLVLCDAQTVRANGEVMNEQSWAVYPTNEAFGEAILNGLVYSFTSTLFVRTQAFHQLGGFDRRLRFHEDLHFLYRAVKTLKWSCVPEALSRRVFHSDSMSHFSRNPHFEDQITRRRLFLNVLKEFEPDLDIAPLMLRQYRSVVKQCIVLGRRCEALGVLMRSWRLDPAAVKTYALFGALALSALQPDRFDRWSPELANARRQAASS